MKFKVKRVARACLRGKGRREREYIYRRMAVNWRHSRHAAWKFPVCFDGMDILKRKAYVEPNEIEAMTDGSQRWRFHIFTRIRSEKEIILSGWWHLYQRFEQSQKMVMARCQIVFNAGKDEINIILDYCELTEEYSPPKLKWRNLVLIRNESYVAITDKGDLCCSYCTIYHDNPVIKIKHFGPARNKSHKRSQRHKKALMVARRYYDECDYC